MEELIFYKNKKEQLRARWLMAGVFILSLVMIRFGVSIQSIPVIIIFILFSLAGVYLFIKTFQKGPSVVVNNKGVKSRVNGMGLIKWDEIDRFEIKKSVTTSFLVIHLVDPDTFLSRMNKLSAILMRSNVKKLGSLAVIPQSEFKEPLADVKDKIEKYQSIVEA